MAPHHSDDPPDAAGPAGRGARRGARVVGALWVALIGLTACGGSSAPGSLPAPAPPVASTKGTDATPQPVRSSGPPYKSGLFDRGSPAPPIEFAVGDERVVLRFRAVILRFQFVETIVVGSEVVYPPQCDAPAPPASGLCSRSHLEFRSVGRGKDLMHVGTHVRGQQLDLLFAGVYEGSSECGAYGYWLLRVDPTGARATSPIVGCSTTPFPEGPGVDFVNPVIRWDPPVSIRVHEGLGNWRRFELNARTLQWTQVARERDEDAP